MRAAFVLCLAGTVAAIFKALWAANAGQWAEFVPWTALAFSTLAHALACLNLYLQQLRREQWRKHAEAQQRAIFSHGAPSHEREERQEALREFRS